MARRIWIDATITTFTMMTLLSISAGNVSVQLQAMTPDTFSTKSGIKLLFMACLNFFIIHSPNYVTSIRNFQLWNQVYEPPNGKPGYASTRYTKSDIPELIKAPNSILDYLALYSGPTPIHFSYFLHSYSSLFKSSSDPISVINGRILFCSMLPMKVYAVHGSKAVRKAVFPWR
ncbi:uncharacterized protein Bfra_007923 [Botrytis fragariae]|uniref:Uncharacterized protein n=1 Tax=Botrytis fragariae TaxID=1964551 RepID=A0A8H6APV6_9HELO|nr:uncharacterized protein Bfra_007923 [Botrytis fragariae]KAF5871407.1 hypothetical protein Bfra_007923 [Botrytis fragariae]